MTGNAPSRNTYGLRHRLILMPMGLDPAIHAGTLP